MKGMRYPDEFKSEAVKQITERGHSVVDVAKNLGISTKSLYKWRQELAGHNPPKMSADINALRQEVIQTMLLLTDHDHDPFFAGAIRDTPVHIEPLGEHAEFLLQRLVI